MGGIDSFLNALALAAPKLAHEVDPEKIRDYSHDEALETPHPPATVLFPRSTEETAAIARLASQEKISMIPRGAGSGLSGAAVPSRESIVISFERMNQILAIDEANLTIDVEPGVITGEIRRAVEERGLFYPPIPASVDMCTIGGNVATNAGGLCAVKYGVTREYVLGLEIVLPSGDVIQTGGSLAKNSTGYNLTQVVVGSEGTLGMMTRITLKLRPLPKERMTLLVAFDSPSAVSKAVAEILKARIVPPTLELLPKRAVECVLARHSELSYPFVDRAAALLIEVDGQDPATIEAELKILETTLSRLGATDFVVATTNAQRDALWEVRKQVRDSIAGSGDFVEADSVVPRSSLPELLEAAEDVAAEYDLPMISYGHAGDGNLHTYFQRGDLSDAEWKTRSKNALTKFFQRTVALHGMISGEHGIGLLKREFMPLALSQSELDLMRRLKFAFDPNNLLNPGKVLPE